MKRRTPPTNTPATVYERIREILESARSRGQSWQAGQLHPNLSWTHYRTLLRVDAPAIRAFYEIEAIDNNWSARELERQINSLLYERLALSRDKKGLRRLARQGQEIQTATDVFVRPGKFVRGDWRHATFGCGRDCNRGQARSPRGGRWRRRPRLTHDERPLSVRVTIVDSLRTG